MLHLLVGLKDFRANIGPCQTYEAVCSRQAQPKRGPPGEIKSDLVNYTAYIPGACLPTCDGRRRGHWTWGWRRRGIARGGTAANLVAPALQATILGCVLPFVFRSKITAAVVVLRMPARLPL